MRKGNEEVDKSTALAIRSRDETIDRLRAKLVDAGAEFKAMSDENSQLLGVIEVLMGWMAATEIKIDASRLAECHGPLEFWADPSTNRLHIRKIS